MLTFTIGGEINRLGSLSTFLNNGISLIKLNPFSITNLKLKY